MILLKHRDNARGQKELQHWGLEEWLITYLGVGGGKEKGRGPKGLSYAKEDSQATGGPAIVKLRLFFPLAKH